MHLFKLFSLIATLSLTLLCSTVSANEATVNMNVTNAEVRDVLTALATVGNVSIMADDSVTGKITIQLDGIPFDTALDLVARTKGLAYEKIGNVIVMGNAEKMGKSLGSVQVIKLQYAKAEDVKKSLAVVLPEDRIKVDEAANALVFSASPSEIEKVRQVLTDLDIPYQQVSLEAEVVAINKNATKDLGVDWYWANTPAVADTSDTSTTVGNTTTTTNPTSPTRDFPGVIRYGRNPEGLPYEFQFQAKISAMISHGDAKILAKPKITTINGRQARILIGDRIPVLMDSTDSNGKSTTTTQYVDAGIKLTYVPRINADGQITAAVHTEVSTPTLVPEMKAYRITTREAETIVRMKDGETMVIGGLIGSEISGGKNKVPFLGDLPILGKLFESVHRSSNETEVMIFLTARIVK